MRCGKMAAGALGVVTTLFVYSLLFNFLSPINLSFFADHFNNHSLFNGYETTFVNNADWLVKQTYNALGNFGHGKHFSSNLYLSISVDVIKVKL